MRFIIIGCGRTGARLAELMSSRAHTVTLVDPDSAAFERLGPFFTGRTILGDGLDRDVLLKAGIERSDGLAAVTDSDETNVVVGRVARTVFHVPRIVARLYDPRKVEIYRRLGLQIVAQITWGVNRIAEMLCYSPLDAILSFGNGDVELVEMEVPALLAGRSVQELTVPGEVHVVALTRHGRSFLPGLNVTLHKGDEVHLAVLSVSMDRLKELIGFAY